MPKTEYRKRRYWEPFLIGISAAIGLIAGYNMDFDHSNTSLLTKSEAANVQSASIQGDGRIEEIIRFIENKYVDSIETEKMTINLINDMLSKLDPHSSYITPEELEGHNERMSGTYRGVGIESLKLRDTFYITSLVKKGPAELGGMQIGDAFLKIGDREVAGQGLRFQDVRELLKDSLKNTLEIEVQRLDKTKEKLTINISEIVVPSASICYLLDEETAYLKLSRFSANTYEQFIESIESLKEDRTSLNLVLDLRDNPGGFLPQAIKILSQLFGEKDKLLTYTEGLNQKKQEFRSTGNAFYNIGKVAILIDGYSASGSEILSGAIQDWDRGIVIGETSYGKGLVQEIYPLRNGGALRLTVAKYYTPSGRLIQKSYASENNVFEADSNRYETKVLARELRSGNGISPDLKIPSSYVPTCYDYGYYFDFYIMNQMIVNGSQELVPADLSKSNYNNYIATTYNEDYIALSNGCNQDFDLEIWKAYNNMILDDFEYMKFLNKNDSYVSAAMEFMEDNRQTLSYLSEEK